MVWVGITGYHSIFYKIQTFGKNIPKISHRSKYGKRRFPQWKISHTEDRFHSNLFWIPQKSFESSISLKNRLTLEQSGIETGIKHDVERIMYLFMNNGTH